MRSRHFTLHLAALIASALVIAGCNAPSRSTSSGAGSTTTAKTGGTPSAGCRSTATSPKTYQYASRPDTDPERTSLDVYMPAGCGPVPVVMWVHGGGWQRGDKATGLTERKASWVNSLGAALVAINYRLTTENSGVRWPDHGNDVAAAVAWVQREGPSMDLDAANITLLGHSAGAHLVSIVGTHPTLLAEAGAKRDGIACIIALDISFDLATAPSRRLITAAFGTDPAVLADASPNVQVERNGAPDARFLVGTRSGASRVTEAQDFVDLINRSGGSAKLLNANPYSHSEISSQIGAPNEQRITPTTGEYIRACNASR